MVAPTITWEVNKGSEGTPTWDDPTDDAGWSHLEPFLTGKTACQIPGSGSDVNEEWYVMATADVEISFEAVENTSDKSMRIKMVNNDSANPFTNAKLTIWDNNDETGTTKDIVDTTDTSIYLGFARTGKYTADGEGNWLDGGAWTWPASPGHGGTTKKTLGDAEDGIVEDGYYEAVTMLVTWSNLAVPGDNSFYFTLGFDWT